MYQNSALIKLRTILRKTGIIEVIKLFIPKKDYELHFETNLFKHIEKTDTIFDIGANRGYYTKKFLNHAVNGKIYAFEPVPACNQVIQQLLPNSNLHIKQIAIGSSKGQLPINVGNDDLNATSTLTGNAGENAIIVEIETLDDVSKTENVIPNVIKIDVEGFELEVLKGMPTVLKNSELCVIAIEVHFGLLKQNGMENAPSDIVKLLKDNGFKIRWVDNSHIIALRGRN